MSIFIAAAVTLGLVLTNVLVHYEVLYGASRLIPRLSIPVRTRMLVVIMACLFAHVIEITLFGLAYLLLQQRLGIGSISGETDGSFLDFFYFSAATYSTLGLGDVFPLGPLRLVAGIEALSGFVLIGWSASFTYLSMQQFWDEHRQGRAQSTE